MARIAGVTIPGKKRVFVALTYVFGIGRMRAMQILEATQIDPQIKADDLTDDEVNRIRKHIEENFEVEGDLRREVTMNIKRLIDLGAYRGVRHRKKLPVRGQKTKTNARTRKGKKKTVAGKKK